MIAEASDVPDETDPTKKKKVLSLSVCFVARFPSYILALSLSSFCL
jgi:hypothetical protein